MLSPEAGPRRRHCLCLCLWCILADIRRTIRTIHHVPSVTEHILIFQGMFSISAVFLNSHESVQAKKGELKLLNSVTTGGSISCHVHLRGAFPEFEWLALPKLSLWKLSESFSNLSFPNLHFTFGIKSLKLGQFFSPRLACCSHFWKGNTLHVGTKETSACLQWPTTVDLYLVLSRQLEKSSRKLHTYPCTMDHLQTHIDQW